MSKSIKQSGNNKSAGKIVGILVLLVGLILCFNSIKGIQNTKELRKGYIKTKGTVIKNQTVESTTIHRPHTHTVNSTSKTVVQFQADGELYTVASDISIGIKAKIGTERTVYYNPDNPSDAMIEGMNGSDFFIILGTFFAILGLIFILLGTSVGDICIPFLIGFTFLGGGFYFISLTAKQLATKNYGVIFINSPLLTIIFTAFILLGTWLIINGFLPKRPKISTLKLIEFYKVQVNSNSGYTRLIFLNESTKIPTLKYFAYCCDEIPDKFKNGLGKSYFLDISKNGKVNDSGNITPEHYGIFINTNRVSPDDFMPCVTVVDDSF